MTRHSDTTLMRLTKAELLAYVRIAEYSQEVAEANVRQLEEQKWTEGNNEAQR